MINSGHCDVCVKIAIVHPEKNEQRQSQNQKEYEYKVLNKW